MTFVKILKLKIIHHTHCAHKGKGGSIKPCRAQEAGGLFRHQQKQDPKNYPQILLHGVQEGKAKLQNAEGFRSITVLRKDHWSGVAAAPVLTDTLGFQEEKNRKGGRSRWGRKRTEKHRSLVNSSSTQQDAHNLFVLLVELVCSQDHK